MEKNVIPVTIITIITTHRQFSAAHSDPSSVDCVCFTFTFTLSLSGAVQFSCIRPVLIVVGFKELQFMAGRLPIIWLYNSMHLVLKDKSAFYVQSSISWQNISQKGKWQTKRNYKWKFLPPSLEACIYRTQVNLGSDSWVRMSVSPTPCWDLTDVTLADEDTNSILADNAKGAIQGNEAMQVM